MPLEIFSWTLMSLTAKAEVFEIVYVAQGSVALLPLLLLSLHLHFTLTTLSFLNILGMQ